MSFAPLLPPRTRDRHVLLGVVAALTLTLTTCGCGRTQLDPHDSPTGGEAGGPTGSGGSINGAGGESTTGGASGAGGVIGTGGASGVGGAGGTGGARRVIQLTAGDNHTCALLADGTVRCWGKNDVGQLGYGHQRNIGDDELPSSVGPVSVSTGPGVTVKQLTAAVDRTCAILNEGSVKCWGANQSGQLGYGHRQNIGDDELPSSVGTIRVTSLPLGARALAAGGSHTCALLEDGSVKCWGLNNNGELGYGNTVTIGDDELPSAVGTIDLTHTLGITALSIAAGRFETCALLSDLTLRCWGLNTFGELGYGNTVTIGDDETPASVGPISVSPKPGIVPAAIVAGDFHTCALLSDGSVRCWGSSIDGEVGAGKRDRIGDDELPSSIAPVSLGNAAGVTATAIVAGFDHTCARFNDGTLRCWGANVLGELGLGNLDNVGDDELPSSVGPVSVSSTPGVTVTSVTAGYAHTCALLSDGSVKCWGDNRYGQLGYGHTRTIGDDELPSSVGPVSIY